MLDSRICLECMDTNCEEFIIRPTESAVMTKTAVEEAVFDEPITDSDINESEVESTEETGTVSYDDVTGTPIPTQLVKHVRKESRSKKLMHHSRVGMDCYVCVRFTRRSR